MIQIFIGPIIHSLKKEQVQIITKCIIIVKDEQIVVVEEVSEESQVEELKVKYPPTEITILADGQFLIPGLIDTHTHAPQFPNVGLGYDRPLLDWLNTYTFPLEIKYSDTSFAGHVYQHVVNRTLRCGTTTAVYFGTVHPDSCMVLAEAAHKAGQRALVGKVNMDRCCPAELQETLDQSVADTEEFIQQLVTLKDSLVKPVITPRFAISCSASLMEKLGNLAKEYDFSIQTHLSENKEEIKEVHRLFPDSKHYTDVYDRAKLLTKKTILAHCIYLSDSEVEVIKMRGCSVAHCPNSNISLQSGLCDVRRLLDAGVNVSLGTDVAGGSNPSILDAIRCALHTSITLSFIKSDYKILTHHEAFYLATMGGAIALDKKKLLGNFVVGKLFDAMIVDTKVSNSPMDILSPLKLSELFEKFIYTGDDRNIVNVYVNGRCVIKS